MYSMDDWINNSDSADSNDNKSEHKESSTDLRNKVLKKYAEVKSKRAETTYEIVFNKYRETMRTSSEIKDLAYAFVNKHKNANREKAESQTFWVEFFDIFGIPSEKISPLFEYKVKGLSNTDKGIDLFLPGVVLIEQKSVGKNLDDAYNQALGYLALLKPELLPQYIIVSDFKNIHITDLDLQEQHYSSASISSHNIKYRWEFSTSDLVKKLDLFDFLGASGGGAYSKEYELNMQACELITSLYMELKIYNKFGTVEAAEKLQHFLMQTLFCLFAEDSTIFEKSSFTAYLTNETNSDGSDLSERLIYLYKILSQDYKSRASAMPDKYQKFPYINGNLFNTPKYDFEFYFNGASREALMNCSRFEWSRINPMIFGSLFQEVMETGEQRAKGAHYTSEENIFKLINDLFVKDLEKELSDIANLNDITPTTKSRKIDDFIEKLHNLKFFDPACGSGNFLILAYREIRKLELNAVLLKTKVTGRQDLEFKPGVKLENFIGIDMESYAVEIAKVAMWLMEHQCNVEASSTLGKLYETIPLRGSAEIYKGNSLEMNWQDVCKKIEHDKNNNEHIFILGNPPFIGSRMQSVKQKEEIKKIFNSISQFGELDYVTCWFKKASDYIQGTKIQVAFVATNSVCQGLHVSIFWKHLMLDLGIKINFAHSTFKWSSEIKHHAAVYCVILGFATFDRKEKYMYGYNKYLGKPNEIIIKKDINPYLIDEKLFFVDVREYQISNMPEINFGNMPRDGGNFIIETIDEKRKIKEQYPNVEKYIKKYIGAYELINNKDRWCFWLLNASPKDLSIKPIKDRVEKVKKFREASKADATRRMSETPHLFAQIAQRDDSDFVIIPIVSSENRKYIPIGFANGKTTIASNLVFIIPNADKFLFGVLTSRIHNEWIKIFAGALGTSTRYSKNIVYNNFPFPDDVADKLRLKVIKLVDKVLEIREEYFKDGNTLADLYGELTMPADLRKAHTELDKAVELCYRKEPSNSAEERIAFLLRKYDQLVNA